MREDMKNNEYPILVAHLGYLDYEGSVKVADSFLELCKGGISARTFNSTDSSTGHMGFRCIS
ncbi:hypothetical protein PGLA_07045 [Paenibacillus glacialis]|uniref:Uncharacterized protein n=1 Tax=Paenibacillus glacialis TaxID=494026 RepID=A0A168M9I6_9BACL|nr:hypothetical protein PGLA_07045 [Paenibacillus glacialis]